MPKNSRLKLRKRKTKKVGTTTDLFEELSDKNDGIEVSNKLTKNEQELINKNFIKANSIPTSKKNISDKNKTLPSPIQTLEIEKPSHISSSSEKLGYNLDQHSEPQNRPTESNLASPTLDIPKMETTQFKKVVTQNNCSSDTKNTEINYKKTQVVTQNNDSSDTKLSISKLLGDQILAKSSDTDQDQVVTQNNNSSDTLKTNTAGKKTKIVTQSSDTENYIDLTQNNDNSDTEISSPELLKNKAVTQSSDTKIIHNKIKLEKVVTQNSDTVSTLHKVVTQSSDTNKFSQTKVVTPDLTHNRGSSDTKNTEVVTQNNNLSGLKGHSLTLLMKLINLALSQDTDRVTVTYDFLCEITRIKATSIKTTLKRLVKNGYLEKKLLSKGPSSKIEVIIPFNIINKALQVNNDTKITQVVAQSSDTRSDTNTSSSSIDLNLKNTTTKAKSKSDLPEEWQNIDLSNLDEIGFREGQLLQVYNAGTELEIVSESLEALRHDITRKKIPSSMINPLGIVMKCLRVDKVHYNSYDKGYVSEVDKAFKEMEKIKLERALEIQELREKRKSVELDNWKHSLSRENLKRITGSDKFDGGIVQDTKLSLYFEREILENN